MKRLSVLLLLSLMLAGCIAVTPQGVVFYISPIVDTRVPSPEAVAVLEEIEEETGEACIDLATADNETLQLLIHIGPVRAGAIEQLRARMTFEGPADLLLISGISEGRLAAIIDQGLVCP